MSAAQAAQNAKALAAARSMATTQNAHSPLLKVNRKQSTNHGLSQKLG